MDHKILEKDLKAIFGERCTTSYFERWFYSHDIAAIPAWAKSMFKTIPVAVVKPKIVSELVSLLAYCNINQIAVVPRGSGSSGLFGSVPKKGGIVIDLTGMTHVIQIDKDNSIATVECGITWWELDRKLRDVGLTLKSYPSSARSATAGGWVVTGGSGIGTLKYGKVSEQLLSADILLADGTINSYQVGQGLEDFFESEGMLGILINLRLKVNPILRQSHHLVHFSEINDLPDFLEQLTDTTRALFAAEIFDSEYLALIKTTGQQFMDDISGGASLITFEGSDDEISEANNSLEKVISLFKVERRPNADAAWRQRFNTFMLGRAAPSVLPSSVQIPLRKLNQFRVGLNRLKKRPIGLTGQLISKLDIALMPLLLCDERKTVDYTFALHTPGELSGLALSLGGKPGGGFGVWNAGFHNEPVFKDKVQTLKKRKKELDPKNILNPGMWTEAPFLLKPATFAAVIKVASVIDAVFPIQKPVLPEKLLPKETLACVQCGYCMNYCPTKQEWFSSTPRGRILTTQEYMLFPEKNPDKITSEQVDSIFQCNICGRCRIDCSVDIRSPQLWLDLRNDLVRKGLEPQSLKEISKSIYETKNIALKQNSARSNWIKKLKNVSLKEDRDTIYFTGCVTALYPMVQDIATSFSNILNLAGIGFITLGEKEWCCGYPLLTSGHKEQALELMEHNISEVTNIGPKRLLVTCPGCYRMWKYVYPETTGKQVPFEILHSTQLLAQLIKDGKLRLEGSDQKVTYHDPCDLGRNGGIYDDPRYVLSKIPGLEFLEMRDSHEYCSCCGAGGDLLISNPDLSLKIGINKINEIALTGAQAVITACPSCIRSINMAKVEQQTDLAVYDITQFVWKVASRKLSPEIDRKV